MWDLIEITETTQAQVEVAVTAQATTKKPSVPTQMELKVWEEIRLHLEKKSLTLEETRALAELKSLMKLYALQHMHI